MNKNKPLQWGLLIGVCLLIIFISFTALRDSDPSAPQVHQPEIAETVPGDLQAAQPAKLENQAKKAPTAKASTQPEITDVRVFGTVSLADSGEVVPNAEVQLVEVGPWEGFNPDIVTTDDQGHFEFFTKSKGRVALYARKNALISFENKADEFSRIIKKEDTSIGPIHLKLYPAKILKLRVVSKGSGDLLPGAKVGTFSNPEVFFEDEQNGLLSIPLTKDLWTLQVMAPGHQMKRVNVDLTKGFQDAIEIALDPAGRIFGFITDEGGHPVADAWVYFRQSQLKIAAKSAENGSYLLDHLPIGKDLYVQAQKKNVGHASQKAFIGDEGEAEVSFVLEQRMERKKKSPKDVVVEGYVVDNQDEPIEGASVTTEKRYGEQDSEVITNEQGFFRLIATITGGSSYAIHVTKPGFARQIVPFETSKMKVVKLKVVLEEGHFLKGVVLSESGEPIENASVTVELANFRGYSFKNKRQNTDASGFFEYQDLPEKITLRMGADGFSRKEVINPELDREDAEFVLEGLGLIRGRVVYKDSGEPVTAYKIFISGKKPGRSGIYSSRGSKYPGGLWIQAADGAFKFEGLELDQHYELSVEAKGYGLEKPREVKVVHVKKTSPVLLELEPFEDRYAGVILDSGGRPLAGVTLQLKGSPTGLPGRRYGNRSSDFQQTGITFTDTQTTDSSGAFAFEAVPSNIQLHLEAKKSGYATGYFDNLEGINPTARESLAYNLYRSGKLLIVVEKDPMPNEVYLGVSSRQGQSFHTQVKQSGIETEVADLSPDTFNIRAFEIGVSGNQAHRFSVKKSVVLEEGETLRVVLDEDGKRSLSGTAMVNGTAVGNRRLILQPYDPEREDLYYNEGTRFSTTDDTGHFKLSGIDPGTYKLHLVSRQQVRQGAFGGLGIEASANFVMITLADQDVEDVFSFRKFSQVTGKLADATGISSVLLSHHPFLATNSFQAAVNLDGTFQFVDVQPGIFSLHVLEGAGPGVRLVLSEIVIPENGSDVDLGEVDSEPVGRVRLIMQSAWLPPKRESLMMIVFGAKDVLDQTALNTSIKHRWEQLHEPMVIDGLAEGSYGIALLGYGGGFVIEPESPIFEIHANETTDVVLALKPITQILGLIPGSSKVVSASMVHEETGQTVAFEILPSGAGVELFLRRETFAISWEQMLTARGVAEGSWFLTVRYEDGESSQQKLLLKKGESLYLDLVPNKNVQARID